MYSNKENVNILTSLLVKFGIRHAVVCPGSRNSPIVHNLYECPDIICHPVTDERSAGFYAIGIADITNSPVVLCVTSGSALLDTAPAVAEAFYRHVPLVVVSADRPEQWIGQLDGQTMQQVGALNSVVKKSITISEPSNDEQRWYCNRLVNEALICLTNNGGGPVHINVSLTEPLFCYDTPTLPEERKIKLLRSDCNDSGILVEKIKKASRPLIVIGQMKETVFESLDNKIEGIDKQIPVLYEKTAFDSWRVCHFEEILTLADDDELMPDFIIYIGDVLISKRLKLFLRSAKNAETWTVRSDNEVHDTFMNLTGVVQTDSSKLVSDLYDMVASGSLMSAEESFVERWHDLLNSADKYCDEFVPAYSEMAVVKYFEEQMTDFDIPYHVCYANSSVIRLAEIYACHYVWCNRGINGIDGCLSTAVGMSAATDDMIFCLIGDLSFFYDQNALWNNKLNGNIRIVLINNGEGAIFEKFEELKNTSARDAVIGKHSISAQGICTQNDCGYIKATNMDEMQLGIVSMMTMETKRPVVLEVFTDGETDAKTVADYYSSFKDALKKY